MDDPIMIEAAGPHRPAFAAWCLAQDPPIQTASATGFLVPVDLYPSVPPEVLEGAYVDGYLYGGPGSPVATSADAGDPVTGLEEADPLAVLRDLAGEQPVTTTAESTLPTRRPRKRSATRKAAGA